MSRKSIGEIIGKAHAKMIEVKIGTDQAGQSQIKIEDQPDLRYARIVALEVFTQTDLAFTFPSNYQTMDGVDMSKITLILETNDADDTGHYLMNEAGEYVDTKGLPITVGQKPVYMPSQNALGNGRFSSTQQNIKWLPLSALHRVQNAGFAGAPVPGPDPFVRELQTFYNMYVSWDKCLLQIVNGGLGNTAVNIGVPIMVYYSWLDINGKRIVRT